ncbi:hypothetical protein [Nocardia goodfellowii]|uniref:DUF2017 domain-containing protein n=1 Tax=Nocardia goodfellowii TaxID=882446 RepID=A0ABS4QFW1_9NOCA|nr:hypothetical protein [Nocardia goodfellowii]MBP2190589.1 hypothetical protein [Nocardia goodfellowii]
MTDDKSREQAATPIPVEQMFGALDDLLTQNLPEHHYNVEAGLARLKATLELDSPSITASAGSGTLREGSSSITSSITPESAWRDAETGTWHLSWLPDRPLTREQARAGMELDELLSDTDSVHNRTVHDRIAALAGQLDMLWQQAVILLSKRYIERHEDESPAAGPGGIPRKERLDQWHG